MEGVNESISHTLTEMMLTFTKRMDSFDETLRRKTAPASSIEGLAEEFAAFKTFILSSLRSLQLQVACVAGGLDQLEMRSRRKILLLHGIAEEAKEDTVAAVVKIVKGPLKQNGFTADDVGRCHRMGRQKTSTKARPILLELRDGAVRAAIWSAKSALKGSGTTVSEFLTKSRHDLFMAARQRFGMSKSWTMDGNVFVISTDGSRHRVRCMEDLTAVQGRNEHAPKPAAALAQPPASSTMPVAGPSKTRTRARK